MAGIERPPTLPPVFNASAETIISQTTRLLDVAKATQDRVVGSVTPDCATFTNVILPLAYNENERLFESQLIEFYRHVSPYEDVRNASHQAGEMLSSFHTETAMRNDLYLLVAAVFEKGEKLEPECQKLLQKMRDAFELNGLGLGSDDRIRLRQLDTSLNQIKRSYLDTCENAVVDLWLTLDELEGMDADVLESLERGSGENEGKLRLPLDGMLAWETLTDARHPNTRRRAYSAYAEAWRSNVALLEQSITLRQERAKLLGFPNYADLRAVHGIEKSSNRIQASLDELLTRMSPARDTLMEHLRRLKRQDLQAMGLEGDDDGGFFAWDRLYYSGKYAAQQFQLDVGRISEYFNLEETITRMLSIFAQVMSLTFVELSQNDRKSLSSGADGSMLTWHDDVRMFAVWDDSRVGEDAPKKFLGYLYMDMYNRPGKDGGFACRPVRPAYTDEHGTRQFTSTALICNLSKPTTTKPCLLKHSEVVVIFHELGHGMHDLVSQTQFARFHGASCDEFNETPSQLLEQFCWMPPILRMLSQHHSAEKPAPLPEDLLESLIRSKQATSIRFVLGMLNISLFDMSLATQSTFDTTTAFHSLNNKVFGVDTPDSLAPYQATLREYFTVDGMYIYLTTQVYAQDLFDSAFRKDPLNREEGLRYRQTILEKGSSRDEMGLMREFLGRDPRPDAFYKSLGLE